CAVNKLQNETEDEDYLSRNCDPQTFTKQVSAIYTYETQGSDDLQSLTHSSDGGEFDDYPEECSCLITKYGPITIKPRKHPALTLATGRKSKYDVLPPTEAFQRERRRQKNRIAQERAARKRKNLDANLREQIVGLETQSNCLEQDIYQLNQKKVYLETLLSNHEQTCTKNKYKVLTSILSKTNHSSLSENSSA
ncbi:unnamed protein product, partial [Didymodactylos carnosus]